MTDSVSKPAAPELLLASHLKTLRLPTFLREHDKLGRQCARRNVIRHNRLSLAFCTSILPRPGAAPRGAPTTQLKLLARGICSICRWRTCVAAEVRTPWSDTLRLAPISNPRANITCPNTSQISYLFIALSRVLEWATAFAGVSTIGAC